MQSYTRKSDLPAMINDYEARMIPENQKGD